MRSQPTAGYSEPAENTAVIRNDCPMTQLVVRFLTVLSGLYLALAVAAAHEGHDHGAPPPPVSTTIAPRADASSADFELVAISRGETVRIYLDSFKGNEPISGATVDVDVGGELLSAKPDGDGVYVIQSPKLARPGQHDLAITIQTSETVDILTATLGIPEAPRAETPRQPGLGTLMLAQARAIGANLAARLAARDQTLLWTGTGSFALGAGLVALLRRRRTAASAALVLGVIGWSSSLSRPAMAESAPAMTASVATVSAKAAERDIAQRFADGALFVPKSTQRVLAIRTLFTAESTHNRVIVLPGRVIPDPNGAGVVQSSVSGRLQPPAGGFPRLGTPVTAGQVLATVIPAQSAADITSQEQQKREIEQEMALVERRLRRWQAIPNAVPRQQVEEAQLEMEGLRARLANLQTRPLEPERLLAPVAGVISSVRAVAGQIAEPNTVIFEIVDPQSYWVEALSYEALSLGETASGQFSGETPIALAYRGTGLAERAQAVTLHFEIMGETTGLRAGQFLTVLATTQETQTGIAVPRSSVIRASNGQSIVYEHTNAERFVPRKCASRRSMASAS